MNWKDYCVVIKIQKPCEITMEGTLAFPGSPEQMCCDEVRWAEEGLAKSLWIKASWQKIHQWPSDTYEETGIGGGGKFGFVDS